MIERINNKLKSVFGITQSELVFVALLALGLAIGAGYRYLTTDKATDANQSDIYFMMDSLANAYKSTYTGSDMAGNRIEELAAADTVVEEKSIFPKKPESKSTEIININTASKVELMRLPGVGEKTAIKIINFRKNNPFGRPVDIRKIKGIGPKKFAKIKDMITTGN